MSDRIDWDSVFAEVRRIMMTSPEMWRCGTIDEAMLPQVWEELDQSEIDLAIRLYRRYEHELDPLMPIVRWRAAVRPFVLRAIGAATTRTERRRAVELFENDDTGYREWIRSHPGGFVLNVENLDRKTMKMHRASCWHISEDMPPPHTTTWTTKPKACSEEVKELKEWARSRGVANVPRCGTCDPDI